MSGKWLLTPISISNHKINYANKYSAGSSKATVTYFLCAYIAIKTRNLPNPGRPAFLFNFLSMVIVDRTAITSRDFRSGFRSGKIGPVGGRFLKRKYRDYGAAEAVGSIRSLKTGNYFDRRRAKRSIIDKYQHQVLWASRAYLRLSWV